MAAADGYSLNREIGQASTSPAQAAAIRSFLTITELLEANALVWLGAEGTPARDLALEWIKGEHNTIVPFFGPCTIRAQAKAWIGPEEAASDQLREQAKAA